MSLHPAFPLCLLYLHLSSEFRSLLKEQPRNASVIAKTVTKTKFLERRHFMPFALEDTRCDARRACSLFLCPISVALCRFMDVINELVKETERTREKRAKLPSKHRKREVVEVDNRNPSTKVTQEVNQQRGPGNFVREQVFHLMRPSCHPVALSHSCTSTTIAC